MVGSAVTSFSACDKYGRSVVAGLQILFANQSGVREVVGAFA